MNDPDEYRPLVKLELKLLVVEFSKALWGADMTREDCETISKYSFQSVPVRRREVGARFLYEGRAGIAILISIKPLYLESI